VRIIAGKYKGRNLLPPKNLPVRPTTDFARTGLFNLLSTRIELENCDCLDLFTGTGAISFELASRGCKSVVSVDRHDGCINFIKSMSKTLNETVIRAVKSDVSKFLLGCNQKFDLIFADPPFDINYRNDLHKLVFEYDLLNSGGFLVVEHPSRESMEQLSNFEFARAYGNVGFSFFRKFEDNTSLPIASID